MIIALSFLSVQVNRIVIVCFDQTLLAELITFKKIELCIFSTVLFTANSARLYTWSIEFLLYIGKSHITHVPSLLLAYGLYHSMPCYSLLSYRDPGP